MAKGAEILAVLPYASQCDFHSDTRSIRHSRRACSLTAPSQFPPPIPLRDNRAALVMPIVHTRNCPSAGEPMGRHADLSDCAGFHRYSGGSTSHWTGGRPSGYSLKIRSPSHRQSPVEKSMTSPASSFQACPSMPPSMGIPYITHTAKSDNISHRVWSGTVDQ